MTQGMFITDFDGTLLRDDRRISDKDLHALMELGNRGVVRVVATGRSLNSFMESMEKLGLSGPENPLPVDFVIFSTGAGIIEFPLNILIRQHSLASIDVKRISSYFEAEELDYMVHKPIPHTREFVFRSHGRHNPDFWSRIELYQDCSSPISSCGIKGLGRATQVLAVVPRQKAFGVVEHAKQELSGLSVIRATSPLDHDSVWIEVFPPAVSKSRAASWLAARLGIERVDVVALGNDYNDLDLLHWAGRGFVVENAPDDLKSGFVTFASNNRCGVAQAISKALELFRPVPLAFSH